MRERQHWGGPKRLWEVAIRWRPPSTRIKFFKPKSKRPWRGHARIKDGRRDMLTPAPVDTYGLWYFIHESLHLHLGHLGRRGEDMEEYEFEYECERLTIAVMRLEGLVVDHVMTSEAKKYIRRLIKKHERKTGMRARAHIRRWAFRK